MIYAAYNATTGQITQVMGGPYEDCLTAASVNGLSLIEVSEEIRSETHMVTEQGITEIPAKPSNNHEWNWTTKTWEDTRTIEAAKAAKRGQINSWRMLANRASFDFAGKKIACDELSRSDIEGVNGWVAISGSLPAEFPGGWKAIDNTYVAISTVQDWKDFFGAMVAKGTENFARAQQLKALLASPTITLAEIDAITWS